MMTKINMDELIADREAGTDGPWGVLWYHCTADSSDVQYAKKEGREIALGSILWRVPHTIGPIDIEHNHWAGNFLDIGEEDTRRIVRLPDLEAAYIEAVELIREVREHLADGNIGKAIVRIDRGPLEN